MTQHKEARQQLELDGSGQGRVRERGSATAGGAKARRLLLLSEWLLR
jgi:hypothetical protein